VLPARQAAAELERRDGGGEREQLERYEARAGCDEAERGGVHARDAVVGGVDRGAPDVDAAEPERADRGVDDERRADVAEQATSAASASAAASAGTARSSTGGPPAT
jgi:hypothetical protein